MSDGRRDYLAPVEYPAFKPKEPDMEQKQEVPEEICIGNDIGTRDYGGGIVMRDVPIHVGKFENRGNCMAHASLGGRGGIDSSKEAVMAFAGQLVHRYNSHATHLSTIEDQARTIEAMREAIELALMTPGMIKGREALEKALALAQTEKAEEPQRNPNGQWLAP